MTDSQQNDTVRFHRLYQQLSGYRGPLPTGAVRRWEWYLGQLDQDEITTKTVAKLHDAWEVAAANDDDQRGYVALVPTAARDLRADTPGEFVGLLRMLIARSGVSACQIARRAPDIGPGKLNKSQIYSVLDRRVLPRRGEQVRSWVQACGLDPDLVDQLLALWAGLNTTKDRGQDSA